jgi:bifunctional oxygenase/reductase
VAGSGATSSTLDADVLIAGAGPVGLLLAGDLCAKGFRVTVLEQRTAPVTGTRASTLHTRTMALFAERGVLGRLGNLPDGGPGHFGGLRLDLTVAAPGNPYAGQWKCPQARVEAVLYDRAVELGARVRRGWRLTGLVDLDDHVAIETVHGDGRHETLTGEYLVGCDGEDSTVRRLAAFDFAGEDATKEMLRADVAGIDIPNRRFERHPNGLATAARWPDGSTRVMVHVFGAEPGHRAGDPGFDEVVTAWRKVTGEDIGHGTPLWLNAFDNTSRQVTRYRHGRVLLAGDAAHVQMPVGGQALNLGLQDAAELGACFPEALDDYHAARHPVDARALTNIQAQTLLLLGGPEVEPLREIFAELLAFDTARGHLARMISTPTDGQE